jgi:hypothetical protein
MKLFNAIRKDVKMKNRLIHLSRISHAITNE